MIFIYLLGLFLCGLGVAVLLFGKNKLAIAGIGFPIGAEIYIAARHVPFFTHRPLTTIGALTAVSLLCIFIRLFRFEREKAERNDPVVFSKTDYMLLAANAIIWLWNLSSFIGFDPVNHFFFAAQIQKGILPPSGYSFSQLPAKYHYGWDILLSDIRFFAHCPWSVAEDILSAIFIISNSIALLYVLKRLFDDAFSYLAFGCFMFGTGVLWVIRPGRYLQLFHMYHQHAWAFTTSVFLLYMLILVTTEKKHYIAIGAAVLSIGIAAPVYSAHAILLHGVFLAFCGLWALVCLGGRDGARRFMCFAIVGMILLVFWQYFGWGIMANGPGYSNPHYWLSIRLLGLKRYAFYMLAYILMTPIALIVFCGIVLAISKCVLAKQWPCDQPGIMFCALCVILLYPIPFVIMMADSALWDNFCKFNYIGILASWLLVPCLLQWVIKITGQKKIWVLSGFASVVLLYPVIDIGRGAISAIKYQSTDSIAVLPELSAAARELPPGEMVLINPELNSHYKINKTTKKAEVNLYDYIGTYFGRYVFLATELGFPVVNFYDYNFLYSEELEEKQVAALDRLYRGDETALHELSVSYLIAPTDHPDFIRRAVRKKILSPLSASSRENWALFKVNRTAAD